MDRALKTTLADIVSLTNVDIVFTDIYMPEISGFDIINQLPKHGTIAHFCGTLLPPPIHQPQGRQS